MLTGQDFGRGFIAATLALAVTFAAALPASAGTLRAAEAKQIVEDAGFTVVGQPNFWPRRGVYVVFTKNELGERERVMVSTKYGLIVSVDKLAGATLQNPDR